MRKDKILDQDPMCRMVDLRFQALPDEITASHSSLGGEFGEWIDVVKDASCARPGEAGAVHPRQHRVHLADNARRGMNDPI